MLVLTCVTVSKECGEEAITLLLMRLILMITLISVKVLVQQMLVAYVLTGYSCFCHPDTTLQKPPFRPGGDTGVKHHYDSVSGVSGGSKIYITYENGHAYPAYLITYTCI